MKKCLFMLIAFLFTLNLTAQSEKAIFIYRNDGDFNAFLCKDIDSLVHSNIGIDSIWYDQMVVQEVWTEDSIYRIPLAAIDSISFIMPPTIYKEDVTRLEYNLLDYIIGADGCTLKLKPDTPTMILPLEGDKLVLLEGCDVLPFGFSGIVVDVQQGSSSIDVVCEQAYLEDLFDSFCNVQTIVGCNPDSLNVVSTSNRRRIAYNPDDIVFSLGPYKASCSSDISQKLVPGNDLALNVFGTSVSVETQPTFRIHTFLRYGYGEPETYFQCSITGNLRISSEISLYGGLSFDHDYDDMVRYFPIPQTAGLVNYYINPGIFFRANASVASKIVATHVYAFGMAYDYSSKGGHSVNPSVGGHLARSSVDMDGGSLDGSLAIGGYIESGFSLLCREIARVCTRGEMGYQISGNFALHNSDIDNAAEETTLYERLKASSIESGRFVNVGLYASLGNTEANPTKWEESHITFKRGLVPTFSNTKLTHTPGSNTSLDAYTELSGECLLPVPVGYKLFDENMDEIQNYDANAPYFLRESYLRHTFSGLEDGSKYKVYPKVSIFGLDILASPAAELDVIISKIIDFRVTKASYSKGAYYHEGRAYDYKFDAATSVEIGSLDGIEDWGYVYEDPQGKKEHISLKGHGTSYTDTDYAYYRNEPQSTARLYGYVIYLGESEPFYGEPIDYPLIYNNEVSVYTGSATASYTEAKCWGSASDSNNTINTVTDECGFFYNTTGDPENGNGTKKTCSMGSEGVFNATLSGLTEDTQYYYRAFVRVGEDYYYGYPKDFKTKKKDDSTPTPVATTGEAFEITRNSATVKCTFSNVPEGGVCGVEYTSEYGVVARKTSDINNGSDLISLTDLKAATDYTYHAFIEANGTSYNGADSTFTTQLPDISGTWTCTEYDSNGTVYETFTVTLKSDGKAEATEDYQYFYGTSQGDWGFVKNGKVGEVSIGLIYYLYDNAGAWKQLFGVVNNLQNPTSIEGTSEWYRYHDMGGSARYTHRLVMTR